MAYLSLFVLCLSVFIFPLNVELSVKECAGYSAIQYPISVVVPLPEGAFQDISKFRVSDAGGTTIPAQFSAIGRRWLNDNSISNLQIRFQPTVAAHSGVGSGVSSYFLKDDGSGNATGTNLSIDNGASIITVNTGRLKFTVKKAGFNLIDQLWYDKDGNNIFSASEEIIKSNSKNGGEFKGRLPTDLQYDADRSDIKVEIEESGPMVAIIRAEAVTKYSNPSDHTHGWAVRIYAYAGKSFVKIDYQLQNSAKTKKVTYPLYFEALNLNFDLNLSSTPVIKVGLGNGSTHTTPRGSGILLAQKKDSLFSVYGGLDTNSTPLVSGGRPDGYLNIDDGTMGLTVVTRNFWRMYPNGLSINSSNKLTIELWPEWSSQINAAGRNPKFNETGLYWLVDMQHSYKEILLNFHGADTSNGSLAAIAKQFDFHPVATLPTTWIAECRASLDLNGQLPYETRRAGTTDMRRPNELGSSNTGWNYFYLNGRRTGTAQAGGWPHGLGSFFVTENPADWFIAEWSSIGDMNIRPQSMAQFNFAADWPFLNLGINVCNGGQLDPECYAGHINWRAQSCGSDKLDSALISGTESWSVFNKGYCESLPYTHAWMYHLEDAYWITANPWLRDWYGFMKELRKTFISSNRMPAGISDRGNGHFFAHAMAAYKVTGDTSLVRMMVKALELDYKPKFRRQFGDKNSMCCGQVGEQAFEVGFIARQLINIMNELESTDPQSWSDLFQLLSGWMDWNYNYANFASVWAPSVAPSYVAGGTLADPVAWYYWNTGRSKYREHLLQYITTGIGGGTKDYADMGKTTYNWNGQYEGRWVQYVKHNTKPDSTPPEKISDLKLFRSGNLCQLSWTAPINAYRYHVVWAKLPIVGEATENINRWNWWAANSIGPKFRATHGTKEYLSFNVPDTGYPIVFAAVFSFDSANNMSLISNLGKSDSTPPSAVSNLLAIAPYAHSVALSWSPSTDQESGISHYRIYRDGLLLAETDTTMFIDKKTTEETIYQYQVAAVNMSLSEGALTDVSITTPKDTIAPTIIKATAINENPVVTLLFNERLEKTSAEAINNYLVDQSVAVISAALNEDLITVVLTLSPLTPATTYRLTINGVKDISSSGNAMSGVSTTFTYRIPFTYTDPVSSNGRATSYTWGVAGLNERIYISDVFEIMRIPKKYVGLPMLKFDNDKDVTKTLDTLVMFETNKEVTVYVARDDRIIQFYGANRIPSMFTKFGYSDNGDDIYIGKPGRDTLGVPFSLFQQTFPAGKIIISGNNGYTTNYSNYFVMVMPTDSSLLPSTTAEIDANASTNEGFWVSPNPFNPSVNIIVQTRINGTNRELPMVNIFNIQGKKVGSANPIYVGYRDGLGRFEYKWSGNYFPSGTYFAVVNISGQLQRRKIVLLK